MDTFQLCPAKPMQLVPHAASSFSTLYCSVQSASAPFFPCALLFLSPRLVVVLLSGLDRFDGLVVVCRLFAPDPRFPLPLVMRLKLILALVLPLALAPNDSGNVLSCLPSCERPADFLAAISKSLESLLD